MRKICFSFCISPSPFRIACWGAISALLLLLLLPSGLHYMPSSSSEAHKNPFFSSYASSISLVLVAVCLVCHWLGEGERQTCEDNFVFRSPHTNFLNLALIVRIEYNTFRAILYSFKFGEFHVILHRRLERRGGGGKGLLLLTLGPHSLSNLFTRKHQGGFPSLRAAVVLNKSVVSPSLRSMEGDRF